MKKSWFVLALIIIFSAGVFADSYIVESGDTLSRIAQEHLGSSARWNEIAELNDLHEPYALEIGQQLEMPDEYQQIDAGEALLSLSQDDGSWGYIKFIMLLVAGLSIPFAIIIGLMLLAQCFSWLLLAIGVKQACRLLKNDSSLGKCYLAILCVSGICAAFDYAFSFLLPSVPNESLIPTVFVVCFLVLILVIFLCFMVFKSILRSGWLGTLCILVIGGILGLLWHVLVTLIIAVPVFIFCYFQNGNPIGG